MVRVFPLVRTGQPEWSVRKWSVPFSRSGSANSWRNVSAILKKCEELVYNLAFKLENSITELTFLAGQF